LVHLGFFALFEDGGGSDHVVGGGLAAGGFQSDAQSADADPGRDARREWSGWAAARGRLVTGRRSGRAPSLAKMAKRPPWAVIAIPQ
jgi:hypothetical protein